MPKYYINAQGQKVPVGGTGKGLGVDDDADFNDPNSQGLQPEEFVTEEEFREQAEAAVEALESRVDAAGVFNVADGTTPGKAIAITPPSGSTTFDNRLMPVTLDPAPFTGAPAGVYRAKWFKYTPTEAKAVTITSIGTTATPSPGNPMQDGTPANPYVSPDTYVVVMRTSSNATSGALTQVAANDDGGGGGTSSLQFAAQVGYTYYIAAAMYSSGQYSGAYKLNWSNA